MSELTGRTVVVATGLGTNSTAMLELLREQGVRPDLILFADTGAEKPHTYAHLEDVNEWCRGAGFPEVVVVKPTKPLEEDCITRKTLPSLAFGFKTCSQRFKAAPQNKYLNHWKPAKEAWARGEKVVKCIGYDSDEFHRARFFDDPKFELHYPLIDARWGRRECREAICRMGLKQPGKSACFFCPSSKVNEILDLRDRYPDLLKRALDMEKASKIATSVKGLGRRFSWTEVVDFYDKQGEMFGDAEFEMHPELSEQVCGCYDGE